MTEIGSRLQSMTQLFAVYSRFASMYSDTGKLKVIKVQGYIMLMLIKRKCKWLYYIRANFKAKKITRDWQGHYIMTKRSIHQEETVILNVISPNNRAAKYMKKS